MPNKITFPSTVLALAEIIRTKRICKIFEKAFHTFPNICCMSHIRLHSSDVKKVVQRSAAPFLLPTKIQYFVYAFEILFVFLISDCHHLLKFI